MKRIILIGLLATALAAAETPQELYQKALVKERSEGKLDEAIQLYRRAAEAAGKDRALAANALVQLAACYEKLGNKESRKTYERVVRDYTDQKEAVAMARARLGHDAKTTETGIVTRQVWTGPKVDISGAVSPDGRLITFTDWSTGDLALHDLTTGQDRRLTNKDTSNESSQYAYGSVFSRDGKQIVYAWTGPATVSRYHPFLELRMTDLNGGKPRVLFSNRDIGWVNLHDWSPDGKWLAVQLDRVDHIAQIGLISTVDGALRVLRSIDWRGVSKMAFSPDGRYLAYDLPASEDSEQRDIHLMALDSSRETPVVVHPANDRVLGWSLDGKHLLFASDRSGSNGMWALPVADGKLQGTPDLIKADINPSPIGLTQAGALYYSVVASGRDVYVASVDFETGKMLSSPTMIVTRYAGFNDYPQWSPDGKLLAYMSRGDPSSNSMLMAVLAIRSMETGQVRELRPNLAYLNNGPLWSPDGAFFVANGADKKGRTGVYRIDAQSGETVPLVISEPRQGNVTAQALSPDGKVIFLVRTDMNTKKDVLLARDVQSGNEREILRRDGIGGVAISRDGRLLAITGFDRSTKSGSVLLVPVEGGDPRELLRLSQSGLEPLGVFVAWSPDNKFLLFRKGPSSARETFRIPVAGGIPARFGAEWTVRPPAINPDGRQVAFAMSKSSGSGPNPASKVEIWALENFLPTLTTKK